MCFVAIFISGALITSSTFAATDLPLSSSDNQFSDLYDNNGTPKFHRNLPPEYGRAMENLTSFKTEAEEGIGEFDYLRDHVIAMTVIAGYAAKYTKPEDPKHRVKLCEQSIDLFEYKRVDVTENCSVSLRVFRSLLTLGQSTGQKKLPLQAAAAYYDDLCSTCTDILEIPRDVIEGWFVIPDPLE